MFSLFSTDKNEKSKYLVTDADKRRTKRSLNAMIVHEHSLHPEVDIPVLDMPTKYAGGGINLLRAVYDGANDEIRRIDDELQEMDTKRRNLIADRDAHYELYNVAEKYMTRD